MTPTLMRSDKALVLRSLRSLGKMRVREQFRLCRITGVSSEERAFIKSRLASIEAKIMWEIDTHRDILNIR